MDWQHSTLGEICELYQPKTISGKDMTSGGRYPVFGANGIIGRYHDFNHEAPQLVIGCRGSVGAVHVTEPYSWITGNTMVVKPKGNQLSVRFVEYYLRGGVDLSHAISGTAQPQITRTSLSPIPISFPPLPEQQRIVTKLDAAFAALAEAQAHVERNRANARELFESYLNGVFEGKGDDWPDVRLGDISDRVSVGHVGPTSKYYCSAQEGVPILRSQNVRKGKLDWDGIQYITKDFHRQLKKSRLQRGDLLFVRVGANRGDCCAILEDVGELNCANIVFARPTEGNAAYLEQYCRSTIGRTQLLGMTTGSAQGVINTSSVAELMVPLPSVKEQEAIVARSKEVHHQSQQLEATYQQKLMELEGLKKGLLGAAFRGEL